MNKPVVIFLILVTVAILLYKGKNPSISGNSTSSGDTVVNKIISVLANEEGFSPVAYRDSFGYSIGYGTFLDTTDEQQYLNKTITKEEGKQLMLSDVLKILLAIHKRITVPLNDNQLAALTCMLYNLGLYPITDGSLDDLINSNAGKEAITNKWLQYDMVQGKHDPKIKARRQREVNLYFS